MRTTLQLPRWVWWSASGVLLGVAFLHPLLWWTAFFGLVLLIHQARTAPNLKEALLFGFCAGCFKMGLVLSFFWTVYPLDWVGIASSAAQLGLLSLFWSAAVVSTGLGVAVLSAAFSYGAHGKTNKRRHWYVYAFFPPLLVLSEIAGSAFLSIFMYGPGGSINTYFSFGYTGYTLTDHTLGHLLAPVGGAYLLSFALGACAALLYALLLHSRRRPLAAVIGIVLFVALGYAWPLLHNDIEESGGETTMVALIETRRDNHILYGTDPFVALREQVALEEGVVAALLAGAKVVVLPESARFSAGFSSDKAVFSFLKEHAPDGVVLIDSIRTKHNGGYQSGVAIYDASTDATFRFEKQYLVPGGEFIPYFLTPFISYAARDEGVARVTSLIDARPGRDQTTLDLPGHIPSVLFCFESALSWEAKRIIKGREGPDYIAHLVSHAWFTKPQSLWYQQSNMLKVQARFADVAILQASNMAPNAYYDRNGRPLPLTTIYQNALVSVDMAAL